MANAPKKKVFYHVEEVCGRLGLSLLDMSVLVSEGKMKLSTAVPGVRVEEGHYEIAPDGSATWIAAAERSSGDWWIFAPKTPGMCCVRDRR